MDKIESGISVGFGCYRPLLNSSFSQGPCRFVVRSSLTRPRCLCSVTEPWWSVGALEGGDAEAGGGHVYVRAGSALWSAGGATAVPESPNVRTTATWLQGAHVHVRCPSGLQTSFYRFDKQPSTSVRLMGFRFGFYFSVCSREAAECSVGGDGGGSQHARAHPFSPSPLRRCTLVVARGVREHHLTSRTPCFLEASSP